jgi:hypothetical protein
MKKLWGRPIDQFLDLQKKNRTTNRLYNIFMSSIPSFSSFSSLYDRKVDQVLKEELGLLVDKDDR